LKQTTGTVTGVNGNLVKVQFEGSLKQNEIGLLSLGEVQLKGEVIRIKGNSAELQVFEDTQGVGCGDLVEFSGQMLSAQLGPGLLGTLFDGLQNPLHSLAKETGSFTPRGFHLSSLDPQKLWPFIPSVKVGDLVRAGDVLGTVPEGWLTHKVMVPFGLQGPYPVKELGAGSFCVSEPLGLLSGPSGEDIPIHLSFDWPVKKPVNCYKERIRPSDPLITQIRIIDSLFPVAKGGTYCIPGPFGAGKTVLQQITSRYAEVDVVIIAACGERANEVVETIQEFPQLIDPKTGRSLMERTVIICNTSSMPVAARESSVYTAVTIGEYYRQMGLDVLLLADSTSRWAQALRERSGRLEEIPGEEAFPAYLESTIAGFYERAGLVKLSGGGTGSLTIGGTVSPAGGNFEEPVTKATLKVVGAFHGLSRERSDARRFPAIDPLESWSKYQGLISLQQQAQVFDLLRQSHEIEEMMKVLGEEGTTISDFVLVLKGQLFDRVFLQQNAFDPVDVASAVERQIEGFGLVETMISSPLSFEDKSTAREFFHQLTQDCIDWNNTAVTDPRYQDLKKVILEHLSNGGADETGL